MPSAFAWLWRLTAFATLLVAGYLVGHVIVLARYFDWLIANGRAGMIRDTYSIFRVEGDPVTPYLGSFVVQFLLGLALAITAVVRRRELGGPSLLSAVSAVAALPVSIAMFALVGFHGVEDKVMTGSDLSAPVLATWLSQNVPAHCACAGIYIVPGLMLLWRLAPIPFSPPPHR